MKKLLLLIVSIIFSSWAVNAQNAKYDSLKVKLSNKIKASQSYFEFRLYPEIAFIRNEYKDTILSKQSDLAFIARLNDIYYKRFYPMRRLLDSTFVITEDCMEEQEIAKDLKMYRLSYYGYNPNWTLPPDYFEQLQAEASKDEALAPYYALQTIYFLKKYRNNSLTVSEKAAMSAIEQKYENQLYTRFVENQPWGFYKILSVKVLKLNNYPAVKNIDLSEPVNYYLQNGLTTTNILDVPPFELDKKDNFLVLNIGMDKVRQINAINLLWIILNEKNR